MDIDSSNEDIEMGCENKIKSVDELSEEDEDRHLLGVHWFTALKKDKKISSSFYASRRFKMYTECQEYLKILNDLKPGPNSCHSNSYSSDTEAVVENFMKFDVNGESYYMSEYRFGCTARAVAEKLTFVHDLENDQLIFKFVPTKLTDKEEAVLKLFYNVKLDGRVDFTTGDLLKVYHKTSVFYQRNRYATKLYCEDGESRAAERGEYLTERRNVKTTEMCNASWK